MQTPPTETSSETRGAKAAAESKTCPARRETKLVSGHN